MFNPFQRTCADAYCEGDFAHVEDIEQVRAVSDTLFTFLMIELGTPEDCDTREEALRRMAMAIGNIQDFAAAIEKMQTA
ncbi:hypothetical protein OVY48_03215 [Sphingobium sp. SA2]|jgi:hypothetical protein|uniref:Uncharacterized protein n=2 Tax=Sphingobium TaxID=165695 RepID=A0A401J8C5_SPHXE|nr:MULTISPECIES: hypothetical protein [Sphingobium]MDT7532444.1 hypothetical protein [Sphingobium sp. SA2]RJG51145.1 hypothetical protein D0Z70_23185 [Sphingobium terrigena]GBH32873.1 hypothetical protein MBESOW_P4102 [Sphingobium xenophagum]|tara:strand:- start:2767 stop:3003 length:237 start_codon:yes stop_codon:yes gene_type:complete